MRHLAALLLLLTFGSVQAQAEAPEATLLGRINTFRAAEGLAGLAPDPTLTDLAERHLREMVAGGYFAHCSPNGRCLAERLRAAGYEARLWAENLAAGFTDPHATLAAWQASPEHRANLLRAGASAAGIAYAPQRIEGMRGLWVLVVAAPR